MVKSLWGLSVLCWLQWHFAGIRIIFQEEESIYRCLEDETLTKACIHFEEQIFFLTLVFFAQNNLSQDANKRNSVFLWLKFGSPIVWRVSRLSVKCYGLNSLSWCLLKESKWSPCFINHICTQTMKLAPTGLIFCINLGFSTSSSSSALFDNKSAEYKEKLWRLWLVIYIRSWQ